MYLENDTAERPLSVGRHILSSVHVMADISSPRGPQSSNRKESGRETGVMTALGLTDRDSTSRSTARSTGTHGQARFCREVVVCAIHLIGERKLCDEMHVEVRLLHGAQSAALIVRC